MIELLTQEPLAIVAVCVALALGLLLGLGIEALFGFLQRQQLQRTLDRVGSDLNTLRAEATAQETVLHRTEERLGNVFNRLANEQLQNHTETFLQLASARLGTQQAEASGDLKARQQAIEALMHPVREALTQTQDQMHALERSRQEAYGGIRSQLESMGEAHKALQAETHQLVTALRRPEVRGQWGEITLKRLVELAGMVEHCDFVEQPHQATEDGAVRPDLIIHMPEDRKLVVDVKTPLDAYLDATQADDDKQRAEALARHATNVATHIRKLAAKNYWAQFDDSPEFVILFIPGDQFLSAALAERPELLDDALRQKVILATPTSLVALLKAVNYGWQQLALAENAQEIRSLAIDLYERLVTFTEHLSKVGQRLSRGVDAYNQAVGSLERMVLPSARKFTELGVQPRRKLEAVTTIETSVRMPDKDFSNPEDNTSAAGQSE
jgi:DNA recombination protein RmuC